MRPEPRILKAAYPADCRVCGARVPKGSEAEWRKGEGLAHIRCLERDTPENRARTLERKNLARIGAPNRNARRREQRELRRLARMTPDEARAYVETSRGGGS